MGVGGGASNAEARSRSGLSGTDYFGSAAARTNQAADVAQNWTQQVMSDPLRFGGKTGQDLYGSGQFGLGFNVDPAVRELSRQLYSYASGSGAAQGRLTPEGSEAAAGSALTQALPSLIPQLMQFGQWQFQLPMGINQYAQQVANNNLGNQAQALGQEGRSNSNAFNFDFGLRGAPAKG